MLSVVLAVASPISGPGNPVPPVALNVFLPWDLSNTENRIIGILIPIFIALLFWRTTREEELRRPSGTAIVFLAIQTILAFLVAEELQFVVAVEAGLLLSTRTGCIWVFGQASAAWLVAVLRPELMAWVVPQTTSRFQGLLNIGILMLIAMLYNFLAFSLGLLAAAEGRQRRTLQTVIHELREAELSVAENARLAERLRLSRELHDCIGHQLSSLSINLQIASRISQDQARGPILEAYQLVNLLLSDVRAVVNATDAEEIIDLPSALELIASRVKEPGIHLDLIPAAAEMDCTISHALFRCAQEFITNSVRHSGATDIWICTRSSADDYVLTAWDNGRGNTGLVVGNGLRGMQERVRELSGSCSFLNRRDAGFEVSVRIPWPRKRAA